MVPLCICCDWLDGVACRSAASDPSVEHPTIRTDNIKNSKSRNRLSACVIDLLYRKKWIRKHTVFNQLMNNFECVVQPAFVKVRSKS